jgi:hypothetical protein
VLLPWEMILFASEMDLPFLWLQEDEDIGNLWELLLFCLLPF